MKMNGKVKMGKTFTPPSPGQPHILALRFQDGDHIHSFPIQRRIICNGVRYRIASYYMGAMKCGHQLGVCFPSSCWRCMAITDADQHKHGIGPTYIKFEGEEWNEHEPWWRGCDNLVHITKFGDGGSEFCIISPRNPADDSLDVYRSASHKSGTVSLDVLYVPA